MNFEEPTGSVDYLSNLDGRRRRPLLRAEEEVGLAIRIEAGVFAETILTIRDDNVQGYDNLRRNLFYKFNVDPESDDKDDENDEQAPRVLRAKRAAQLVKIAVETTIVRQWVDDEGVTDEDLKTIVKHGKLAVEDFMLANQGLVKKIAFRRLGSGVEPQDLITAGNIGLLRAVVDFDYTLGYKFSTKAQTWIWKHVDEIVAWEARTIRLPDYVLRTIENKLRPEIERYWTELGRAPSVEEMAKIANISTEDMRRLRVDTQRSTNLSQLINGGDRELADSVPDSKSSRGFDAVLDSLVVQQALDIIKPLVSEHDFDILLLHLGFKDGIPHSYHELAQQYGVSNQRIQQIITGIKGKLKKAEKLEEFFACFS